MLKFTSMVFQSLNLFRKYSVGELSLGVHADDGQHRSKMLCMTAPEQAKTPLEFGVIFFLQKLNFKCKIVLHCQ